MNSEDKNIQNRTNEILRKESSLFSDPQFSAIYDHFPGILFSLAVEAHDRFRFVSVSNEFLTATGLPRAQVIGKLMQEVLPASTHETTLANYQKAISSRTTVRWEETSEDSSGKKYGDVCVSPVLDSKTQSITLLNGIIYDITERRRVEKEREQYYKFFRTSADLMCIAEPNSNFRETNPSFSEVLGFSAEELVAKPFLEFIHPDDKQATIDEMARQTSERGFSYEFENRYLCKDNSVRWLSWRATFDREVGLTYATARDITDRKKFEEDLLAAKKVAEAAAQSKTKFLDIAAHELRTPVAAMSMLLQLVQMQLVKAQPLDNDIFRRLSGLTDRLGRLVVDLLDISRLERGLVSLQPVSLDMVTLISQCIEEFQLQSPQRHFVFAQPTKPLMVEADCLRINQVLANLLDNAIKYTPPENPIEIILQSGPETLHVSVIDQGEGISISQQKTLFSAFSRGNSDATLKASGLGLGLSVCRSLIELHGGKIWAESQPGRGSIFHFEIPISRKTPQS